MKGSPLRKDLWLFRLTLVNHYELTRFQNIILNLKKTRDLSVFALVINCTTWIYYSFLMDLGLLLVLDIKIWLRWRPHIGVKDLMLKVYSLKFW